MAWGPSFTVAAGHEDISMVTDTIVVLVRWSTVGPASLSSSERHKTSPSSILAGVPRLGSLGVLYGICIAVPRAASHHFEPSGRYITDLFVMYQKTSNLEFSFVYLGTCVHFLEFMEFGKNITSSSKHCQQSLHLQVQFMYQRSYVFVHAVTASHDVCVH